MLEIKKESEIARLSKEVDYIASQTKSEATKKAYASDLRRFKQWCSENDQQSFPATPDTVALYIVSMDRLALKPSTIRRAMSAISQVHVLAGQVSPVTHRVLEIKKGIHRIRGTAQTPKTAITLEILRRVINHIPPTFLGARNKAVLLVGWVGALRRSELCSINYADLNEEESGICVTIRSSKTDQEGHGRKIGLPFIDNEPALCPVRNLRRWLRLSAITEGPVFVGVGKGAHLFFGMKAEDPISPKTVGLIVKRCVKDADYDPRNFAGHSLRSGLATSLARAGIDERRIAKITGHKNMETLRRYIQDGELFRDHPVCRLF